MPLSASFFRAHQGALVGRAEERPYGRYWSGSFSIWPVAMVGQLGMSWTVAMVVKTAKIWTVAMWSWTTSV